MMSSHPSVWRRALSRSERVEKDNPLLEIEGDPDGAARFAGTTVSAGKANVSR
jgi:enolase